MAIKTTLELRLTLAVEGMVFSGLREGSTEIDGLEIALVGPGGKTLDVPEAMFTPAEMRKIVEALVEAREDRL